MEGRWEENVENFKQACTLVHTVLDGNAIFAEDRDETTRAVSTGCRLNVAPTAARKISGFAVFVRRSLSGQRLRVADKRVRKYRDAIPNVLSRLDPICFVKHRMRITARGNRFTRKENNTHT